MPANRQQIVDYLAPAVGDETYPQINWVWFRLVVQTFLASVGGPIVRIGDARRPRDSRLVCEGRRLALRRR